MKKSKLVFLLIALLAVACSPSPDVILQVSNTMNEARSDASILLSRGEISRWIGIPDDKLPVLSYENGQAMACQLDDLDGDGNWDEIFGLISLEANEQIKLEVRFKDADAYPQFHKRTNLHLGAARQAYAALQEAPRLEGVSFHNYGERTMAEYQMEGIAWENDKVGFRNYMDQRNGMDIFGKLSSEMVLDEVGKEGGDSYHEPANWGMDILKVGTSLGAGGIAYLYKDSLYRVGDNGSGTYQTIMEGSQRSRFLLNYSNWQVEDMKLEVNHQIEITAGRHYYQSEVSYNGTDQILHLVPGIVNMKSKEVYLERLDDNYSALFTHDLQAEDTTMLAMALMVSNTYLKSTGEAPKKGKGITKSYYAVLDASPGESITYRFYSLWEKEDERWASKEEVLAFLRAEAERWSQSVIYGTE